MAGQNENQGRGPVNARWNFAAELEQCVPHQIALPDLDDEDLRLVLHFTANRVFAVGNDRVRLERLCVGGEVRKALLEIPTLKWWALDEAQEGRGVLELDTWMRRRTLIGSCSALHAVLALRGRR